MSDPHTVKAAFEKLKASARVEGEVVVFNRDDWEAFKQAHNDWKAAFLVEQANNQLLHGDGPSTLTAPDRRQTQQRHERRSDPSRLSRHGS